jgi:DNA-binding FadR family transcriptional regulator
MAQVNADTLLRLRAFLETLALPLNSRLPPERELGDQLGVSRADLRKAMAVLEDEGRIWRHVGRGTFTGARPVLNLESVAFISGITKPEHIMDARLLLEPGLARLAAINGNSADVSEMRSCNQRCSKARDWGAYESWDYKFHHSLAVAARNKLLLVFFETLNAVRRSRAWSGSRSQLGPVPSPDHPSFAEHAAIIDAIANHDAERAEECMRAHLLTIRSRMK